MKAAVARERIIPRGMFRSGSRTSSATLATLVSPAYDTNTKPTVAMKPVRPKAKKGVNRSPVTAPKPRERISRSPCTTNTARMTTRALTRKRWSPAVSLAPTTFTTPKTTASPTARGWMGTSQ